MAGSKTPKPPDGPAVDMLDALRFQGWDAALALLPENVDLSVPELRVEASGKPAVVELAAAALARFPDLHYQPHTRRAGPGLIVDDGFVTGTHSSGPGATGEALTVTVRATVEHDGRAVRSISVSLDPTPVMVALGRPVDPSAAAIAQVQALRAGMFSGLEVHQLAVPPATGAATGTPGQGPTPRPRRGRVPALVAVAVLAAGVVGFLVVDNVRDDDPVAASTEAPTPTPTQTPTPAALQTEEPTPVPAPTTDATSTPEPTVVLSADLAFDSGSAVVSPAARTEIIRLARRPGRVTGTIRVDGYTDDVGSAAQGLVLSQQRADAVAAILREALDDPGIRIVAEGHGETDPAASNATEAGRAKNRRVNITLPGT